jgi:hypothetical protein
VLALNPEHIGAPILMLEAQRALRATDPSAADAAPTDQPGATMTQKLASTAPGEREPSTTSSRGTPSGVLPPRLFER